MRRCAPSILQRTGWVAARHGKQLESAREHQERLSEELASVRRTLDEERAKAEAQASQAGALQAEVQKLREAARTTEAAVAGLRRHVAYNVSHA